MGTHNTHTSPWRDPYGRFAAKVVYPVQWQGSEVPNLFFSELVDAIPGFHAISVIEQWDIIIIIVIMR